MMSNNFKVPMGPLPFPFYTLQNNGTTSLEQKSPSVSNGEEDHGSPPMDSSGTDGEDRQQFFDNLLNALGPRSAEKDSTSRGTFAVCETVKYSEGFILKSLHVEGAGELQLPLSEEDVPKLRRVSEQAPFGKGLATLVDTSVRRCWQVDASKLSFPGIPEFLSDTIQPLAVKAIRALGFDGEGVQLEAHLYKLLLYEEGGHFTFHRDTEKKKGMFATLILQLPTEEGYTGGKLAVKHQKSMKTFEEKVFDCHMVSALGFCYTVFFADCLHELQKIESGTRLCLVFNLVKRDSSLDPVHRGLIRGKVQKVEEALKPWLQEAIEGRPHTFGAKIAIPLQHKYTEENLSFGCLKGDDSIMANVLKECRDQNREKWLELYLCLVTKHQSGKPRRPAYKSRRSYYDSCDSDEDYHMEDTEETIKFKKWIGEDDKPLSKILEDLDVDLETEVVIGKGMGPFDSKPNDTEYEAYLGNSGPRLEYWYHTAMLVAWPKSLSISVACEASFSGAMEFLENKVEISREQVHQVVCFCENNSEQVWGVEKNSANDSVTPRLLRLCVRANTLGDVLQILHVLAVDHTDSEDRKFKIGVRNFEVANAIASAVEKFGWEVVSEGVTFLTRNCALNQSERLAHFAKQLISKGNMAAGALVANTTREVLGKRIAELDLHKEPVFTWYQPHAKLPDYPEVERLLRGPQETFRVTDFNGIAAARSFAQKYFGYTNIVSGYSVKARTDGVGRAAFCEIRKTRCVFKVVEDEWRKEQEEIKRLRRELENLRSVVPETDAAAVPTLPDDQHGPKRQKLDTDLQENPDSRGTVEVIDMTLLNSLLPMWTRGM
ncbi:unnamed protein product [Calypogeia fissa]